MGLAWVPIATVHACLCATGGLPDEVAKSDVAFIGTMVAQGGTERRGEGWETTQVAFNVDRAKEAMTTPVVINAWLGMGSSCGLEMAVGQEWLVIAHVQDGRAETNLCSGSTLLGALDEPTRQRVAAALDTEPVPAAAGDDPLAGMLPIIPVGVWLAGGAVLLVVVTSAVAFRRSRPG